MFQDYKDSRKYRDLHLAESLENYINRCENLLQHYINSGGVVPSKWPKDIYQDTRELINMLRKPYLNDEELV